MNHTIEKEYKTPPVSNLPMIALRGLVVFPGTTVQFDVGRRKSMLAVNEAMEHNQKIFLVAQRDLSDDDPSLSQLYEVGVIATIKQVFRQSDNGLRANGIANITTQLALDDLVDQKRASDPSIWTVVDDEEED